MTASALKYDHNIIIIKNAKSLKPIMIWRSSRKMKRNKKFANIILFMEKAFQVFQCTEKVFHAFCFQLCSMANTKLSLYVSLCEFNCIKIQAIRIRLVSKSIYFSKDSFWFIIHQHLKKKFKLFELFFSSANEVKILCNIWYYACSEILSFSLTIFNRLMEIPFKTVKDSRKVTIPTTAGVFLTSHEFHFQI